MTELKHIFTVTMLLVGLLTGSLGGCSRDSVGDAGDDRPDIVATNTILADLVTRLVGDAAMVTGILDPGDDPHVYEPVPRDSLLLERADLIFYNGYNLEPQIIRLMESAGAQVPQVAVGEAIASLAMTYGGRQVPDPHVWGNARHAIAMVDRMETAAIALVPEARDRIENNGDTLRAELERLHIWIGQQIATIPAGNRRLVTTHDAFQYYAQAYDIPVAGTLIGISTEEQPSARTVLSLTKVVREAKIPTIFSETTINPALIATVAREAGVELSDRELYADSIGVPGSEGDSYINMMVSNTRTIVEGLKGRYEAFPGAEGARLVSPHGTARTAAMGTAQRP